MVPEGHYKSHPLRSIETWNVMAEVESTVLLLPERASNLPKLTTVCKLLVAHSDCRTALVFQAWRFLRAKALQLSTYCEDKLLLSWTLDMSMLARYAAISHTHFEGSPYTNASSNPFVTYSSSKTSRLCYFTDQQRPALDGKIELTNQARERNSMPSIDLPGGITWKSDQSSQFEKQSFARCDLICFLMFWKQG